MSNLAFGIWDEGPTVVVALQTGLSPKSEEWTRYVQAVEACASSSAFVSVLTLSDGGDPSSRQRSRLDTALVAPTRRALITDVGLLRTMARLRRPRSAAFEPVDWFYALAHLDVSEHRAASLLDFAVELQRSVMPVRVLRDVCHAVRDAEAKWAAAAVAGQQRAYASF